jgi:uncharacterized repeat protein (TIGR01451 family)
MKNIMKKGLMALSASLLLLAASGTAHAVVTAGGSTIHNAATLTFTGGTATSAVDVKVNTIASAPTITVDAVAQQVNGGQNATYTYTITNTANGSDVLSFAANSGDVGVNGAPVLNVNGTGGLATSLTLGASVTTQANTVANTIVIPAGSENDAAGVQTLSPGDTINIGGNLYTISTVTPGIIASTTGGVTTPETPTTIAVTPVGASPVIAVGGVPAGTQIGEVQTFTVVVTASTPAAPGVNGTHTVNLTGTTTAITQGVAGTPVTYTTSPAALNETITTVLSPNVTLLKEVRNVTHAGTFATTATAQSGDTLEYRLTATVVVGASASGASITDEVPAFTTYVPNSTTLNGGVVPDGTIPAPNSLPTSAANGGLPVNSAGALPNIINTGSPAVVIFQVTVN